MIQHPQVTSTGKVKGTSVSIRPTQYGSYRIRLERVSLPKNEQTSTHDTIEKAIKAATKLQAKCDGNKTRTRTQISPKDEYDYAEIKTLVADYKNDCGTTDPLTQTSRDVRAIDLLKRGIKLNRVVSAAKQKARAHGCSDVQYIQEDGALGIIEQELDQRIVRHIKPLHKDVIWEYMAHVEAGKDRRNKSKPLSTSTLQQRRFNAEKILRAVGDRKVGDKCDMEETRDVAIDFISEGTTSRTGQPHAVNTKHHIAKEFRSFGEWLELQDHTDDNPYDDFAKMFPPNKDYQIETYTVDEIERLLAFVMTEEKHQKYLPALAMHIFCTVRPTEIGSREEKLRRMNYCQFNRFENKGSYDDYMVHMPVNAKRLDADGNIPVHQTATKISTSRQASLSPNGYEFIKHYWEDIMGSKIPESRKPIWVHRMEWEHRIFCGSHEWYKDSIFTRTGIVKLHDGFRHTVLTMAHKLNADIGYWTEAAGNSSKIFKKHYQNTDVSRADAERFFALTPASILANKANNVITGAVA